MNTTAAGPRLSDRTFFLEKLDVNFPGVRPIREAAEKGDFPKARALFGELLRETLNPHAFFSTLREEAPLQKDTLLKKSRGRLPPSHGFMRDGL